LAGRACVAGQQRAKLTQGFGHKANSDGLHRKAASAQPASADDWCFFQVDGGGHSNGHYWSAGPFENKPLHLFIRAMVQATSRRSVS
jgi:hypothetical protein